MKDVPSIFSKLKNKYPEKAPASASMKPVSRPYIVEGESSEEELEQIKPVKPAVKPVTRPLFGSTAKPPVSKNPFYR
jgi:hypothetical protein